ncbi:TPA: hypothetical protein HA259_08045 [Thermoplasmata archaeon]|nr:hypothetical protein [Thermoplasmata archaeon]
MSTAPGSESPGFDARLLLTDEDRQKMMSIIHSMVFWVGVLVPEYEMLDDHMVELRDVVYRLITKKHLSESDTAEIEELVASLKRKEHDLEHKLQHDPMTVQAGKALMEEIRGILKAIDELRYAESEEDADFSVKHVKSKIEDARRWNKFVEEIRPPR